MKKAGFLMAAFAASAAAANLAAQVFEIRGLERGAAERGSASINQRIRACEKSLASAPGDVRATDELISLYLQKMRETADARYLDLATKLVDRMLARDGGNLDALRFQNEIDLQRHDFRAVVARSEDLLRYEQSDPGIWGNLGDASMELGEYDKARDAYMQMFGLRPNLGSYNRLGYWYFVMGHADQGIDLMRQAIEAGSSTPENVAWCQAELGDMYFKTGRLAEAQRAYGEALRVFPAMHRAYAGLGKTQAALGDAATAIRSYRRAQAIVPMVEYAGALEALFAAQRMLKEAAGQREMVNAIARLSDAQDERTNRNLALVLADESRNIDLALRLVRAEIQDRPDIYSWDALAWVLFRNGALDEARGASGRALVFNTPEPSFYYHAAAIARAAHDETGAQACERRLAALNPRFHPGDGSAEFNNLGMRR